MEKNYSKEKADTLLNIVYSSPLSFIEKAHNIPFFRKELLDQLDKTIPIDYKLVDLFYIYAAMVFHILQIKNISSFSL